MPERSRYDPTITSEAGRLYQVLLRMVADEAGDTGSFPSVSDAHSGGNMDAFGALVDAGLIEHDAETGLVTAVLPFVAQKPWTRAHLDGDDRLGRHAAGVLDAFALAPLLGRSVRVHDRCPACDEPVQALIDPERIRSREPRSAVIVRVPFDGSRQGRFDTTRLACSPEHARAALDAAGKPDAVMQSIEGLFIEARERYATVLE